jgi:hypothetical protein
MADFYSQKLAPHVSMTTLFALKTAGSHTPSQGPPSAAWVDDPCLIDHGLPRPHYYYIDIIYIITINIL